MTAVIECADARRSADTDSSNSTRFSLTGCEVDCKIN
jgi:hypothetical protein